MPNRNYQRGRAYEYKIMRELRDSGWPVVLRTAGSHGAFDIIAIDFPLWLTGNDVQPLRNGSIRLIQCKSGKTKKQMIKDVEKTGIKEYEGPYNVTVEIL